MFSKVLILGCAVALSSCATKTVYESSSVPEYYRNAPPAAVNEVPGPNGAGQPSVAAGPGDTGWPRVFVSGSNTNIVYQPQIDSWDGYTLVARNAVAVETPDRPQPRYGMITVQATTLVDKINRLATLENVRIVNGNFPSAPNETERFVSILRTQFPNHVQAISLDRLEASLAVVQEQQKARRWPLKNTPPKIIFSDKPGILVCIDGPTAYRPVPGTSLERVINTRVLLLKDTRTGEHYLHVLEGYMQAPRLDGPWTVGSAPADAAIAEKAARDSLQVDLLEGQPDPVTNILPSLTSATAPAIFVSTAPAELIAFDGPPNWVPIPGTSLLYVSNTTGNVFKSQADQQIYVLLSGRWFRAPSFEGSWAYVPGTQLPVDFARIPDTSPKENVKASIPGTPQAQEAVIANDIPQSAKVSRSTQMETPTLDGPPQLAPIEGTPLHYVANSGIPIIEVDEHSWYACQDGTWYMATSANGPWTVAMSVPAVIYSIPPSSPLHYVTYVRVYNATDDYVYEGYTPGYLGTDVGPDDVVVYGTGYYYTPWIGAYWFGPPCTWGLGCDIAWAPWCGWCYQFGFGWGWEFAGYHHHWGWHPPAPWWGPYRHWAFHARGRVAAWGPGGWASTSANIYYRGNPRGGVAYRAFGGNEWRGYYGRAYNSRTGAIAGGQRAQVQNVFHAPARFAPTGRLSTFGGNDAFATRDGHVFLRDRAGTAGGWRPAESFSQRFTPPPVSNLERENSARGFGQQRFEGFRGTYPAGGFHGGGGFRGGGGSRGGGGGGRR